MPRAFIVGAGPSLRVTNLDRLVGEVAFAMNRIDLVYHRDEAAGLPGTRWRPTHYIYSEALAVSLAGVEDNDYAPTVIGHIRAGEQCFLRSAFCRNIAYAARGQYEWENVVWFDNSDCAHHSKNIGSPYRPRAWHLPVLCAFGGTLGTTIQLAFMLGYDPLYLIGCDLGYRPVDPKEPDPNHFHPDYKTYDTFPLTERDATLIYMHELASVELETRGRRIYNATIGGALEVYERVDYDSLFAGEEKR